MQMHVDYLSVAGREQRALLTSVQDITVSPRSAPCVSAPSKNLQILTAGHGFTGYRRMASSIAVRTTAVMTAMSVTTIE